MSDEFGHRPVLLDEVLAALAIQPGGIYIDATFGRGGHSREILGHLAPEGRLLACDQDPAAVDYARRVIADDRFEIEHCNFNQVARMVTARGLEHRIDGVLMDLGVSSPQLDDPARGFSFQQAGPLDMRMDTSRGESARDWLARVEFDDLVFVLKRYGEERFAKRIATAIFEQREQTTIDDTAQLAEIITAAIPVKEKHKHPATRSFQAIRIYINRELDVLEQGLSQTADILAVGGRLAVISFHSLEDRMVKRFMRDLSTPEQLPKELPVMATDDTPPYRLVGKQQIASEQEQQENPRARSAHLRVLERVA